MHICVTMPQLLFSHVNQHRICQTCDRTVHLYCRGSSWNHDSNLNLKCDLGVIPPWRREPPNSGPFSSKKHEIIHIVAYFYPEKWAKLEVSLLCIYMYWLTTTWAYISDWYQGWWQYLPKTWIRAEGVDICRYESQVWWRLDGLENPFIV